MSLRYGIVALVGTALFAQQPASAPISPLSKTQDQMVAKEVALGNRVAADVRRQTTPVNDSEISNYVESVGRRLAVVMPQQEIAYSFAVIQDDPTGTPHEPLALPGGYLFISASLLLDARDEAEFAGMLAQGMWQSSSGRINAETSGPVVYMGGMQSRVVPLGALEKLRGQVRQADFMAAQIMTKAGYDPRALVRYIGRVQPQGTPEANSPRPSREARIAVIEDVIAQLPVNANNPTGDFSRIQERLRALVTTPVPFLRY